jgi:hypothetical protein
MKKYELNNEDEATLMPNFLGEGTSKILFLTKNECLFLDDCFTVIIDGKEMSGLTTLRNVSGSASLPVTIDLIEKIGRAVLFTTDRYNNNKDALVELDETELLALREVAQSYIKINGEPVGINLKRKILTLLLKDGYEKEVKKQENYRFWLKTLSENTPRKDDPLDDQYQWTFKDIENGDK